jgi:hypothetical protein
MPTLTTKIRYIHMIVQLWTLTPPWHMNLLLLLPGTVLLCTWICVYCVGVCSRLIDCYLQHYIFTTLLYFTVYCPQVIIYKFISKQKIIPFMDSSILRRIWLNFMAEYLVLSALAQI